MLEAAIPTTRYPRVKHFYAELIGLPVASEGRSHIFFQVGDCQLAVVDCTGGDATVRPSGHGIYLDMAVGDLFSLRRRLIRAGIKLIDDRRDAHGVAIPLQDPEGNLLNLFQEGSVAE
jgi:catechol-2,3-dioxygenase